MPADPRGASTPSTRASRRRWPIEEFTTRWFSVAYHDPDVRDALWMSVQGGARRDRGRARARHAALARDGALLVLRARHRDVARHPPDRAAGHHHRACSPDDIHDGRHDLRLCGRSSSATRRSASSSSSTTRWRACDRLHGNLEEASKDLGADSWQTFRHVTFPQMRSALLAGGLLAFALSWDEVVVTIFTSGARADAADLDLREPLPARRAADRERRGALRHPRFDHPRLDRQPGSRTRPASVPGGRG